MARHRTDLGRAISAGLAAWVAAAFLVAPAGAGPLLDRFQAMDLGSTDRFGAAVALDGDFAIIGAPSAAPNGIDSGAAYIFQRVGGVWTQQQKIVPADNREGDSFGYSVALLGTIAVIGAYRDDDNGFSSGSAYVYVRQPGGTWTLDQKIKPIDGSMGDFFGYSVALDAGFGGGVAIAVSAYLNDEIETEGGAVYVFEQNESDDWVESDKFTSIDLEAMDSFGWSIAMSGDDIIVGTYLDDDNGNGAGAAYVFRRDLQGGWSQFDKLLALDGEPVDNLGIAVDIDGTAAVVGAFLEDETAENAGAAYVFRRMGGAWVQEAKLLAPDGEANDEFGKAVAISGDVVVVGAREHDAVASDSGAAYVFQRVVGTWVFVGKMWASDGQADDEFGNWVAIDGSDVLCGAWRVGEGSAAFGAVYPADAGAIACPGDLNGDNIVNTPDLGILIGAFGSAGPTGDVNGDGVVNTADLGLLLAVFGVTCEG